MRTRDHVPVATTEFPGLPAEGFTNARILIVGDVMLDRYILGDVNRISPEAPVPVLAVRREWTVAGGAANVALNVVGLRARALVAGVVGNDAAGRRLNELLSEAGVDVSGMLVDPTRPTTCKTRVVSGSHQLVRFDEESTQDIADDLSRMLLASILKLLGDGVSCVILSDYAKGVLNEDLTKALISACEDRKIPVLVDPKRENYEPYTRATGITPNQKEFGAAVAAMKITEGDVAGAGQQLRTRLHCSVLLVTQGASGMTLVTPSEVLHFEALAEEVFDVSGAGDTVIAVFATALANGLDTITSARLANVAASLVVRRAGTAPVHWEELYALVTNGFPSGTPGR